MSPTHKKILDPKIQKLFKKRGIYLVLDIGKNINLYLIHKHVKSQITQIPLNKLVVNFSESITNSTNPKYLKDFCTENFFQRKSSGRTSKQVYDLTQSGSLEGAEAFVEFGNNIGALIANLDLLFQPKLIAIAGPLSKSFTAWSHSMGKARNLYRGSKAKCLVKTLV